MCLYAETMSSRVNSDCAMFQENERLQQVIEVRESKLVELSKENLNLQETNAVLRR